MQTGSEGSRQPGRGCGRFGAGFARVGDADDSEGLGQSAQRGNMAARSPAPARLHADDTDSEAVSRHSILLRIAPPQKYARAFYAGIRYATDP